MESKLQLQADKSKGIILSGDARTKAVRFLEEKTHLENADKFVEELEEEILKSGVRLLSSVIKGVLGRFSK